MWTPWLPLTLLTILVVLAAGCSASDPPQSSEATPPAGTSNDPSEGLASHEVPSTTVEQAPETTTTLQTTIVDNVSGRFDDSLIRLDDFATDEPGDQLTEDTPRILFFDMVCQGNPDVSLITEPLADAWSGVIRAQIYYARALTYPSEKEALDALDQANQRFTDCNGGVTNDPDASLGRRDEIWIATEIIDAPPVALSSRSVARLLTHTHSHSLLEYELRLAVVDSTLIMLGTTDPEQAGKVADLIAAKISGTPTSGPIEPTGKYIYVPGYGAPSFWSSPEAGPGAVRALPSLGPEVTAWIADADDERIDEVASNACALSFSYIRDGEIGDRFERRIGEEFNWFDRDANSPETLIEIFATLTNGYCPGVWERVEALIPRA